MAEQKTQISLQMYTLRRVDLPQEEMLKKVREIGYQSIQGGRPRGQTKEQYKDFLDGLGLEMSTYGGDLKSMDEDPESYINECKFFGVEDIMIGTMPTEYRENYDTYMKGIDYLNGIGRKLYQGGCYLAYHNHAQEFRRFKNGKTGMDLLYENLDPNGVRFILDTHWVQAGGADVLQWIEKCKGRMQNIHVKDYRIASNNHMTVLEYTDKQFAEIGEGNLPWPEIIALCQAQGIKYFIVEQDESYGRDPFDCIATSLANLQKYGLK